MNLGNEFTELQKVSTAVYLATSESVANDISSKIENAISVHKNLKEQNKNLANLVFKILNSTMMRDEVLNQVKQNVDEQTWKEIEEVWLSKKLPQ